MDKHKNEQKILFFIFLGGLLLRLLSLFNTTLSGDFASYWKIAGNITKGVFPLLGPVASVNDSFHLGTFFYYFLSIPYLIGNGDYHVAIIFFSIINSLSIYPLYKVCKRLFSVSQSLKITALYTFSSYIMSIQSFPWNSYILPLLNILSLYCVIQVQKGRSLFVPLLFLCFGISLQAHATALFVIPIFLLLLPFKKIPLKFYFAGILLFILSLSPWIYYDLSTNFGQSKAAIAIFQTGKTEQCSIVSYLANHGHGERCFSQIRNTLFVFRLFTMSLFNTQNIVVVMLTIFTVAAILVKGKLPQRKLFILWIGVPLVLYLFYSSNVYLHYFLILIPIPFFLMVLLLDKLSVFGKFGNRLSNLLFAALILLNIWFYIASLHSLRG